LEIYLPAEFYSKYNQKHMIQFIRVFRFTGKLQAGVLELGWN